VHQDQSRAKQERFFVQGDPLQHPARLSMTRCCKVDEIPANHLNGAASLDVHFPEFKPLTKR
jgi:hypothetical protein